MTNEEFLELTATATEDAQKDLEELLEFSKLLIGKARLEPRPRAKTIMKFNTYSAMYQRAASVLELSKIEQGTVANIIVRSMWETLVTYDFINLARGNTNAEILLALESQQLQKNSAQLKELRLNYPGKNTWQETLTDEKLDKHIKLRQTELDRFKNKHPRIRLGTYASLLGRLKVIDDANISRNSNHNSLTQVDYRTAYSVQSGDVHSTILGNSENTRLVTDTGAEIRLDSPKMDTLRSTQVAFSLMLEFVKSLNRSLRLKSSEEIKKFNVMQKNHSVQFTNIESKM